MSVNEGSGTAAEKPPASPASRDELIGEFLRTLRVAFKLGAIYSLEHPAFKKTIDELMVKTEAIFQFLNPLSIGFTPHSLFVDNRFWEGDRTYWDLAQVFHYRKVKRLEIRPGIPHSEFLRFASKFMLPVKAFIQEGGALNILKKENLTHISLDVLDYSQLLVGEGEEIKDIWPYLLMEAVEENDGQKLDQLAVSFEKVVGKFNTEDLIQNEELHKNFVKFFQYLKETSGEKHRTCARSLLRTAMTGRKTLPESKFENLKLLLSDLTEKDLASTLWEEIIGNEKFDSLSFSIFCKITDKERHKKVATSLHELFETDDPQNRKAEVETKIKILLSGTSGQLHSEIYRQTLSALLTEISFDKKTTFDHQLLQRNYRFILINLLAREPAGEMAVTQLERIIEEWERVDQEQDFDFLECLFEVLEGRAADLAAEPSFQKLRKALSELVESGILRGDSRPELDLFVGKLAESVHDRQDYLDRIFKDKTVTPTLLRAYFRFFASHRDDFDAAVKRKASDSDLLCRIADSLKLLDTPVSLATLEMIYPLGDAKVKVHVLQAMQKLNEFDETFLFPVLGSKDPLIQAEALILLMRNERTKHVAFAKLFKLQSPYGIRNKALIRHIRLVEEKDLRAADLYVEPLAQRKDLWNRKVRQEALRVLEKWREG
ncbi:MAG: hypothetical protein ABSG73_12135 [Candidatus Aminicenantales bacterium]